MVTHSSTETADLRRDVIALREWKEAVLDCCKACDGFDALQWGGDKDGWGFVMFFIDHLNTRALRASLTTASGGEAVAGETLYRRIELGDGHVSYEPLRSTDVAATPQEDAK